MVAVKDSFTAIDYAAYQVNLEEFGARLYCFGLVFGKSITFNAF